MIASNSPTAEGTFIHCVLAEGILPSATRVFDDSVAAFVKTTYLKASVNSLKKRELKQIGGTDI